VERRWSTVDAHSQKILPPLRLSIGIGFIYTDLIYKSNVAKTEQKGTK